MSKYRIYKINLTDCRVLEGNFNEGGEVKALDKSLWQEKFEELFLHPITMLQIGRKGDTGEDPLPNRILANHDKITVLRLNNVKNVGIWKAKGLSYDKEMEESNPYLYIIIDNRPGVCQMAIECDSEAWKDPDKARNILEENFNRILKDRGLGFGVKIEHKLMPSEFFSFVKMKRKEGLRVKKLTYEISNPQFVTPVVTAVDASGHIRQILKMLASLGGAKAKFDIDAPRNDELIRKKEKDIKQMVALCASNAYTLKVQFSDNSSYLCNEHIPAEEEIPANYVKNFIDGFREYTFEYSLKLQMDRILKKINTGNDARKTERKPTRKSKSKIS